MQDSGFQSYQFRQINPDYSEMAVVSSLILEFQSYQFRQINPDLRKEWKRVSRIRQVSIVSIQADQSRHLLNLWGHFVKHLSVSIVSIQADQSRPSFSWNRIIWWTISFNRINSGRSIPTSGSIIQRAAELKAFQSYQFRQINPDIISRRYSWYWEIRFQSYQFRQINPDTGI